MATKDKKPAAKKPADAKVTRIKANGPEKLAKEEKPVKNTPEATVGQEKRFRNPLAPIGRYFAGAWYELKQVRWPNRRATWGMSAALLGFTAFFVALILLLDALFKYLFEIILG